MSVETTQGIASLPGVFVASLKAGSWSEAGKIIHGAEVRTERYRYVEFGAAGEGAKHGAMLFDERTDPLELINLADHPAHATVRADLSARIGRYNAATASGREPGYHTTV